MNKREFEAIYKTSIDEVIAAKESIGGIDFFTLPVSTGICVNYEGYRFAILKPYKRNKWRDKAIAWALEQFEKNTLKRLELKRRFN